MNITKQHITAIAIVFLVVLAGCAGDDGTGEITDSTDTTTVQTTTAHPHTTTTITETPAAPSTPTPTDATATPTDSGTDDDTDSTGGTPTDESSNGDGDDDSGVDSPIDGGDARLATVTRIIDGDTIEVEFENGETDTIRLLGVDTPETSGDVSPDEFGFDNTDDARDHLREHADIAHNYVREFQDIKIENNVRIVTDPESDRRGSYGRLLAYVYVEGTNLNEQLMTKGYARHYDSEFSRNSNFADLESQAQSNNKGVWDFSQSDSGSSTPSDEPENVPDKDCGDFDSHNEAQEFFEAHNPDDDPHRLDRDGDGQACESLG